MSGQSPVGSAAHEQHPKGKIGNRPHRLICLICLVTSAIIVTVAGLSIHVSQIRQSKETCHRNYHQLNSSLQSKLSALKSNLSDLHHQICELLTRSREQTCSKDWVTNKDRSYYVSRFETSFQEAKQECSIRYSRLLEINSRDEALFVFHNLPDSNFAYWIEKCENGPGSEQFLIIIVFETDGEVPDPPKPAAKKGAKKALSKPASKSGKKRKRSRKESYKVMKQKLLSTIQQNPDFSVTFLRTAQARNRDAPLPCHFLSVIRFL
ncbi:C-type lectin domain family 9 member A-like [Hypanus sabinus]|uniref:C-type lectin domain family 9 member A-like n=1 Tax=Hypanus sabinus TaxID=79690 RepID=UPI0028C4CD3F|nr:C-type lectin domain family 9 member A-like [Hypanus sabinus]